MPRQPSGPLGEGRYPPLLIRSKRSARLGRAEPRYGHLLGGWQEEQGYPFGFLPGEVGDSGEVPADVLSWVQGRLECQGYRMRRKLGRGAFGAVYELTDMANRPTGLVVKVTADANEAAAARRLLSLGVQTTALPAVLGAWGGPPHNYWFIVREDIEGTCEERPSRRLCSVLDNIKFLFPSVFGELGTPPNQSLIKRMEALTAGDHAMVKRFVREMKRLKKAGVEFLDVKSDNIRLRRLPGGEGHLVMTDFGVSSGPPAEVPIALNPRRGRRKKGARRNPLPPRNRRWWIDSRLSRFSRASEPHMRKAEAYMKAALRHWSAGRPGSYAGNLRLASAQEWQAENALRRAARVPQEDQISWPNQAQADIAWDIHEARELGNRVKNKLKFLARRRNRVAVEAFNKLQAPWLAGTTYTAGTHTSLEGKGLRDAIVTASHEVDAWSQGDSASAKLYRKYRGEVKVLPEGREPCPRCGGVGYIDAFRHIDGGQCFECGGVGSVEVRENPRGRRKRRKRRRRAGR